MKMKTKRIVALAISLSMICSLLACGKTENAVALGIESSETEEDAEVDYLGDISTAPDNTEVEDTEVKDSEVIEFPNDETESTESSEVENTEEVENSESTEKVPETEKPDNGSNGNDSSNNNDSSNDGDVIVDNSTSESTTVPETESTDSSTPSTSGGHISWNGPGTYLSNIGVSIPTLGSFNKEALGDYNGFAGDLSTSEGLAAGQTIYDTADTIETTCRNLGIPCDAGFLVGNNAIEFEFTDYGSMNAFELWRDPSNDRYTLEVNMRLSDGHHVYAGTDLAPYARDILLYMCSVVSSTPDTLYAQILEDITGDICISDSSWTTVGDCKVQYDDANSYDNHYVYLIKAN